MTATVAACQPAVVEAIVKEWDGNPPADILNQLEEDAPWGVLYCTPGLHPAGIRGVTVDHKGMRIIPKTGDVVATPYNWSESNGVLSDGNLKWHVLLLDVGVFAFYMCDDKGPPGTPQAVISVALGPPGGLPDETKTEARLARKIFRKMGINLTEEYALVQ